MGCSFRSLAFLVARLQGLDFRVVAGSFYAAAAAAGTVQKAPKGGGGGGGTRKLSSLA